MNRAFVFTVAVFVLFFMSCNMQDKSIGSTSADAINVNQTSDAMNSLISIFEIPATNFSRAVQFYQRIFDIGVQEVDMPGMQMGLFPTEGQVVSGVIIEGEGYQPSPDGIIIYFNGGDDLQVILDKVAVSGGQVIVPKTLIDLENGYFALFLDTEGNRLGLHSAN